MLAENSSGGDDNYSDADYENDFDEADDNAGDLKLDKLRKALNRENITA